MVARSPITWGTITCYYVHISLGLVYSTCCCDAVKNQLICALFKWLLLWSLREQYISCRSHTFYWSPLWSQSVMHGKRARELFYVRVHEWLQKLVVQIIWKVQKTRVSVCTNDITCCLTTGLWGECVCGGGGGGHYAPQFLCSVISCFANLKGKPAAASVHDCVKLEDHNLMYKCSNWKYTSLEIYTQSLHVLTL